MADGQAPDALVPVLEAHLLDFDGDLYGEEGRVRFSTRLRGERRFEGVDALVAQLRLDIAECRRLLDRAAAPGPA